VYNLDNSVNIYIFWAQFCLEHGHDLPSSNWHFPNFGLNSVWSYEAPKVCFCVFLGDSSCDSDVDIASHPSWSSRQDLLSKEAGF
jgi:hypothetical protein